MWAKTSTFSLAPSLIAHFDNVLFSLLRYFRSYFVLGSNKCGFQHPFKHRSPAHFNRKSVRYLGSLVWCIYFAYRARRLLNSPDNAHKSANNHMPLSFRLFSFLSLRFVLLWPDFVAFFLEAVNKIQTNVGKLRPINNTRPCVFISFRFPANYCACVCI